MLFHYVMYSKYCHIRICKIRPLSLYYLWSIYTSSAKASSLNTLHLSGFNNKCLLRNILAA